MGEGSRRLLFVDVDGVLLDYEAAFCPFVRSKGFQVPEDYESRGTYFYADNGYMTKEQEAQLVEEYAYRGGLAEAARYPQLNAMQAAYVLMHYNVFILSKFKEFQREDRLIGLGMAFGAIPTAKVLSSHGSSKGVVIREVCKRYGVDTPSAMLVDDLPSNLDSALAVGAKALLVEHAYNTQGRDRYESVALEGLTERLARFLVGD